MPPAPAIIFIDEIDAIGKKRTGGENGAVTDSMLNALLTEMDGFSSSDNAKPVQKQAEEQPDCSHGQARGVLISKRSS